MVPVLGSRYPGWRLTELPELGPLDCSPPKLECISVLELIQHQHAAWPHYLNTLRWMRIHTFENSMYRHEWYGAQHFRVPCLSFLQSGSLIDLDYSLGHHSHCFNSLLLILLLCNMKSSIDFRIQSNGIAYERPTECWALK